MDLTGPGDEMQGRVINGQASRHGASSENPRVGFGCQRPKGKKEEVDRTSNRTVRCPTRRHNYAQTKLRKSKPSEGKRGQKAIFNLRCARHSRKKKWGVKEGGKYDSYCAWMLGVQKKNQTTNKVHGWPADLLSLEASRGLPQLHRFR